MGQRESHARDGQGQVEIRNSMTPSSKPEKRLSTMSLNRRRSLKFFRNSSSGDLSGKFQYTSTGADLHTFKSKIPSADLVNVNTCSEEQLMTLPGVDRVLAKSIVERRHMIGRFEDVDELAQVPGIDKKLLKRISSEISASGEPETVKSTTASTHGSLDSVFEKPKPKDVEHKCGCSKPK